MARRAPGATLVFHLVADLLRGRPHRSPTPSAQASGIMFRRSGHTDDRRRRVLTEEVVGGAAGRSASGVRSTPVDATRCTYSDAAKLENHRRVSELVPRRLSMVALLAVLGAAAIGGLVALHRGVVSEQIVEAAAGHASAVARVLDLRQSGSMASWFGAMLLMGAAAASLLVYSLRRHKQSDYHGRYRIWLWTALAAVGMSLCTAAPVHVMLAEQVAARTGWQLPGGLLLLWLVPLGLVLTVVEVRLLLDVRGSRLALVVLLLAIAAQVAGLVVLHTGRPVLSPSLAAKLGVGSQLAGDLLLLLGITLFARHVLLDIEGRLPRREEPAAKPAAAPKKKAAPDDLSSSETVTSGNGQRKIDAPHASPPAPSSRTETATEQVTSRRRREEAEEEHQWYESNRGTTRHDQRRGGRDDDDYGTEDDDEGDEASGHRKLSKAERKRLRRLKAQQRESEFN